MSNIIYCYSASGNCLDMARKIAEGLGDTDIVMMRAFPTVTDATPYERVGFVFPCHGGGNDRIRKKIIPGSCGGTHPYHLPSALSAADRISACGC